MAIGQWLVKRGNTKNQFRDRVYFLFHLPKMKGFIMPVKSYQELIVWQKGRDFVEMVYQATSKFPREEIFGLTNLLRRAAVSIPSNIAEGQGRQSTRDFLNFLSIARGSLQEAETQILVSERLKYLDQVKTGQLIDLVGDIGRLLNGLSKSLAKK